MTIERYVKRWFSERKLQLRPYQPEKLLLVNSSILKELLTVLAAAPNSGKTYMSICFCDWYLEHINPNARILVLTHGTSTLRSQYAADVKVVKPNYTYKLLEKGGTIDNSQVVITLPQTIKGKKLPHFDLLINDEAHHFYKATMVQNIIRRAGIKDQILLTGTPSSFVGKEEYNIIPITLDYLMQQGYAADVDISISPSPYDFLDEDYGQGGDLRKTADKKITQSATHGTLETMFINVPDIKHQKTLYVCRNIAQARHVKLFLDSRKINSLLSTSDNDLESTGMIEFKTNKNISALIVVNRGVLGYSYTELLNVVDLTCSRNIDRQFQLLCRLVRKGRAQLKKRLIKIVPERYTELFKYVMLCTIHMSHEYWYLNYNGTNEMNLEIPKLGKVEKSDSNEVKLGEIKDDRISLFDFGISMSQVYERGRGMDTTTLGRVRAEILGLREMESWGGSRVIWTRDTAYHDALKYPTREEWVTNSAGAVFYAKQQGKEFFDKCTAHMPWKGGVRGRTWDDVMIIAKKYKTKEEWRLGPDRASYIWASASKNKKANPGKWETCTAHMVTGIMGGSGVWDKESVIAVAKKCKTVTEWMQKYGGAAHWAKKNGVWDLCIAHMEVVRTKWTKQTVMKTVMDAKKEGKSRSEWRDENGGAAKFAEKEGFLDECLAHFPERKTYTSTPLKWPDGKLLTIAKKYKTKLKWRTENKLSYRAAQKKPELFIQCVKHMK